MLGTVAMEGDLCNEIKNVNDVVSNCSAMLDIARFAGNVLGSVTPSAVTQEAVTCQTP